MMGDFTAFSPKQRRVLTWWLTDKNRDGIICDGAVRSGKTLCMTISFVTWAALNFDGAAFAVCGKTIASVRRNIVTAIFPLLDGLGFKPGFTAIGCSGIAPYDYGGDRSILYFGFASESGGTMGIGINDSGFRVLNGESSGDEKAYPLLNAAGKVYFYIAVK